MSDGAHPKPTGSFATEAAGGPGFSAYLGNRERSIRRFLFRRLVEFLRKDVLLILVGDGETCKFDKADAPSFHVLRNYKFFGRRLAPSLRR